MILGNTDLGLVSLGHEVFPVKLASSGGPTYYMLQTIHGPIFLFFFVKSFSLGSGECPYLKCDDSARDAPIFGMGRTLHRRSKTKAFYDKCRLAW